MRAPGARFADQEIKRVQGHHECSCKDDWVSSLAHDFASALILRGCASARKAKHKTNRVTIHNMLKPVNRRGVGRFSSGGFIRCRYTRRLDGRQISLSFAFAACWRSRAGACPCNAGIVGVAEK